MEMRVGRDYSEADVVVPEQKKLTIRLPLTASAAIVITRHWRVRIVAQGLC
jgi:hypothetical protein